MTFFEKSTLRTIFRRLVIGCSAGVLMVLTGCASMQGASLPISELETFIPVPVQARIMNEVKIRWEVRDNVTEVCSRAAQLSPSQAWMTPHRPVPS